MALDPDQKILQELAILSAQELRDLVGEKSARKLLGFAPPKKIDEIGDFVTYKGAAKLLKKSIDAIKQLVRRKSLTAVPICGTKLLRRSDVLNYKSYQRKVKSDTAALRGDISSKPCKDNINAESDTAALRGTKMSTRKRHLIEK